MPWGNTGVERTPNKSQRSKVSLEKYKENSATVAAGIRTLDHESGALTNKLSRNSL